MKQEHHPFPHRAASQVAIGIIAVSIVAAGWVIFGTESFGGFLLQGSLVNMGSRDGRRILAVSFDEGESQEVLQNGDLHIVSIPDDPNISGGVPLSRALTSGKRIFGYQYTSPLAQAERDAKLRADQGEPLSFSELFPGTFFTSDEERHSSGFIGSFEEQKNIAFRPLSEVLLEKNSRIIILTSDDDVLLTVRGPKPLQDSFDVYVSSTPSNILAAYEAYGPIEGHLSLTGISDTDPPIGITADIEYEYPRAPHVGGDAASFVGKWVMNNVNVTSALAPYQAPTLVPDAVNQNAWVASYVALQTNGNPFTMHITIEGTASENVRPVLLPRFRSLPWIGHKRGVILKGRTNEQIPDVSSEAENAPYGVDNANIHLKADEIVESFERMSSGLVTMDYRIEEARLPQIDTCNSTLMTKALLENIGITADTYKTSHEWILGSLYQHAFDAAEETMGCSMSKEQGIATTLNRCPHCGPGGWTHLVTEGMANAEHGFGHGLGFAHPYVGPRCGAESTFSPPVSIGQLFLHQGDRINTQNCRLGYNIPGASMGSAPQKPYFHVLDQESLGWLDGKQVTLAAQSGEYDVYSDNADMTSDREKPRIIQVPVMREGEFDAVYIVLPPHRIILQNEVAFSEEYITKINAGVLMYGGERNIRHGKSRMANELIALWYGNLPSDTAIPVGGIVRLAWEGTDVTIQILERTEMHARVRITFANQ